MKTPRTKKQLEGDAKAADWAWENRGAINKKVQEVLKQRIAEKKKSSPSVGVLLRMNPQDLELAKAIAQRKGLPYHTLLKSILHEGLERERVSE